MKHKNAVPENTDLENATQERPWAGKCEKSQYRKRTDAFYGIK